MDRIVGEPGSQRFVSRFTILEMESVLALKFRTGEIDEHSLLTARRRLEADLGSRSPAWSATATRDQNGLFGIDFYYKKRIR